MSDNFSKKGRKDKTKKPDSKRKERQKKRESEENEYDDDGELEYDENEFVDYEPTPEIEAAAADILSRHKDKFLLSGKCKYCNFSCNDLETLARHENEHARQCCQCRSAFFTDDSFKWHVCPLKCQICSRRFKGDADGYINHLLKYHHREKQYPCPRCKTILPNCNELKRHLTPVQCPMSDSEMRKLETRKRKTSREDSGDVQPKKVRKRSPGRNQKVTSFLQDRTCNACGQKFPRIDLLRDHMCEWPCTFCKAVLHNFPSYLIHLKESHRPKKDFQCHRCKKKFPKWFGLKQHLIPVRCEIMTNDPLSEPQTHHKCPQCKHAARSVDEWDNHFYECFKTPHVCHLCGESFETKKDLDEHKTKCSGKDKEDAKKAKEAKEALQEVECIHCGQVFRSRDQSRWHFCRWGCLFCGKPFTSTSVYCRHLIDDHKDKTYVFCPRCKCRLKNATRLEKHLKTTDCDNRLLTTNVDNRLMFKTRTILPQQAGKSSDEIAVDSDEEDERDESSEDEREEDVDADGSSGNVEENVIDVEDESFEALAGRSGNVKEDEPIESDEDNKANVSDVEDESAEAVAGRSGNVKEDEPIESDEDNKANVSHEEMSDEEGVSNEDEEDEVEENDSNIVPNLNDRTCTKCGKTFPKKDWFIFHKFMFCPECPKLYIRPYKRGH